MITEMKGQRVTLEELRAIDIARPPAAGARWKPIPHAELIEAITAEVDGRGWKIAEAHLATGRQGADMAGTLIFEQTGKQFARRVPGLDFAMGFVNSNARRKALKITAGARVVCCLNGMVTGDILLKRVHDHTVVLAEEIKAAVDLYVEESANIGTIAATMRETEVAPAVATDIIMEAGRKGLIGWAAVGRVDAEYRRPTFAEHGRNNAWALLNAFTYAARGNINPTRQMETYNEFRAMIQTRTMATAA